MRPPKTGGKGPRDQQVKELIIKVLRKEKPRSVRELVNTVLRQSRTDLSAPYVVSLVQELRDEGRIRLSETPRSFDTFTAYLLDRNVSLPLWLVTIAIAMTWVSIYAVPPELPWVISRWVFGTLFVIFLPGYAFIEALFVSPPTGKKALDDIARFALSIGMSLALVPLAGLLLNYTPWGIRLEPIAVSLSLLTFACIVVAAYRKFTQLSAARQDTI